MRFIWMKGSSISIDGIGRVCDQPLLLACRENQPGSVVVTANESSTREEKLRAWAGEMGSHRAESRSLRMQLVQVWGPGGTLLT
jgi:hypothetical protein